MMYLLASFKYWNNYNYSNIYLNTAFHIGRNIIFSGFSNLCEDFFSYLNKNFITKYFSEFLPKKEIINSHYSKIGLRFISSLTINLISDFPQNQNHFIKSIIKSSLFIPLTFIFEWCLVYSLGRVNKKSLRIYSNNFHDDIAIPYANYNISITKNLIKQGKLTPLEETLACVSSGAISNHFATKILEQVCSWMNSR